MWQVAPIEDFKIIQSNLGESERSLEKANDQNDRNRTTWVQEGGPKRPELIKLESEEFERFQSTSRRSEGPKNGRRFSNLKKLKKFSLTTWKFGSELNRDFLMINKINWKHLRS